MLQDVNSSDGNSEAESMPVTAAAPLPAPASAPQRGRYGDDKRMSPTAITLVVLLHVGVFFGAALLRTEYVRHKEHRLTTVDIRLDPPPEPPKPVEQPKTKVPEIRRLQPIVPQPAPILAAAIVAMPEVQPAPPPPPAPPAAPPAPIGPPPTVQGGNLGAQMVSGKPPRYPIDSRRKREQGTVLLALVVGPDGRVLLLWIGRSSGFDRLDSAARDAVKSWRWAPMMRDGQPVMVKGVVEIPFVLQG